MLIDEIRLYHTPPKLFKQSSLKDKYVPWHTGVDVARCNWLDAYTSEESSCLETPICESSENRKANLLGYRWEIGEDNLQYCMVLG